MAASITLKNVAKRYRIGRSIPTLRSFLSNIRNSEQEKYHWALKGLSFELQEGEALGIIGPNGAGKTTVLKLLSKVTYPTSGLIHVDGRFSALIELGAGFHPDLTGRENIYLNGVILGLQRAEIEERFGQIVDFAGIGPYLDTPVKRYSSGMYARLGFSVAAHVNPDILLVDEVLAVGDMSFRQKCYDYMNKLIEDGTTLIFVSHDFSAVQRVCSRCLVLYQGDLVFDGSPAEATAEYSNILRNNASVQEKNSVPESGALSQRRMTHGAKIEGVELTNEDGVVKNVIRSGETVYLNVLVRFHEDANSPVFACTIYTQNGELVYDATTNTLGIETSNYIAGEQILVRYKLEMHLLDGIYRLNTDLAYSDLSCYYDYVANALTFVVTKGNNAKGIANLNTNIIIEKS